MTNESPFPDNLEDAIQEIRKLRWQLHVTNEKWSNAVLKNEQVRRSCTGTVKALTVEINRLKDLGKTG